MSNILENRPFAGNWSQDILNKHRKVVSWTPDAIVLLNGDTRIAGCNECKNKIDFQAFITSVGTNAGTTSGDMTASIEMSIPGHYGDSIFKDGEFIFSTGVEVNVYYRGFFEIEGLSEEKSVDIGNDETADLSKVKMRPYYPVFHGVVVSVSYSFSGGFYSASLSCNSLLHFWQNQKVNTNAAYLAAAPAESRGSLRLDGHVYTDMTPHQIIFDLFRDSGGSMDGLEWVFSSSGNQTAKSAAGGSMFSQTLRYWENRFAAGMYGLRMYGASGAMFSSLQTAFLGDTRAKKRKGSEIRKLIKGQHNVTQNAKVTRGLLSLARVLGLAVPDANRKMMNVLDLQYQVETDDTNRGGVGLLATELKAFITDIGSLGNVELFQTSYESKQGIADTVAEKVGYEFYQDVDGDLVFKPPMYNLDTRSSRVYTIKREDVLDISFENQEPEYTYAVCKGSMFRNLGGMSMEGTWGVKGTYVDYRLVAKYGWKPLEFDTTFFNNKRSAFFAAVVELEKKNLNMNGCTLSIPMRPELKPGYPIYIEHIDCFYYVSGISHSFSFGSDCTTGLTLTARRKKFIPPGDPNVGGIDGVRLDDPSFPPKYLVYKDTLGVYKTIGFPNVVMALDPTKPNPAHFPYAFDMFKGASTSLNSKERTKFRNLIIQYAYSLGILKLKAKTVDPVASTAPEFLKGPWVLKTESGEKELSLESKRYPIKTKSKATTKTKAPASGKASDKSKTDASNTGATQQPTQQPTQKTQEKSGEASKPAKTPVKKARPKYYTVTSLKGETSLLQASQEYEKGRREVARLRKRGDQDVDAKQAEIDRAYAEARAKLSGGGEATVVDLIEAVEKQRGTAGNALTPGNTAAILNVLSDKKASFSPNLPGYYRYYSSSHPEAEHQAGERYNGDTKATETLEASRVDGVTDVQLKKPTKTDALFDEVEIVDNGEVKQGFYTKTRYSKGREVIPTKNIFFLSFQHHTHTEEKSASYAPVSAQKGTKGNLILSSITTASFSLITRLGRGKNLKASDLEKKLFSRKNSSAGLTGFDGKLSPEQSGDPVLTDALLTTIAGSTATKIGNSFKSNYPELAKAEDVDPKKVLEIVKDFYSTFGAQLNLGKKVTWKKSPAGTVRVTDFRSPIIPVSDEGGYEVFGSYQYGRGLDIIPQSGFDQLLKADASRALSQAELDDVIDVFYESRKSQFQGATNPETLGVSVAKAVRGRIGNDNFEKLATRLGLTITEQGDGKQQAILKGIGNAIMSQGREQVVTNVPTRLADLRPLTRNDAACDCRGDTSDVEMFLADTGNILAVSTPRDDIGDSKIVEQYVKEINEKKTLWEERQQQLQGLKKVQGGDE